MSSQMYQKNAVCQKYQVMVTKYSREVKTMPKTIKNRNYKYFDPVAFLNDVKSSKQSGSFESAKFQVS